MSRRRKSASSAKKSSENATDQESDEWSEEEKKRLLDALKRDDGKNNWRWITRQVNSKTMNQVKEFAEKLKAEKQTTTARRTSSSSKRPIAPKDTGPLEGWINATKRLRGDNDVDGTCIPQQTQTSREEECQDLDSGSENAPTSTHEELHCNGDGKEEEQQQVPELTSNSDHHKNTLSPNIVTEEQFQRTNSLMEDLLNNQKEMMQKISVLESTLEDLRSDGSSTQSSLMDMLTKITSKLDCLSNNAPHGCCGGPVIIQTTPHANLIHQPVLGSCSSCRDGEQDKRHESSMPVSDKESSTMNEKNDTIATVSLSRTLVQTSSTISQSISSRKSSSESCTANLIIDSHKDSLPQSKEIQSSASSPEVTLCSASAPLTADSSVSTSNCGSSINVLSESPTKVTTTFPPKERLPERCEEKSLRQEPCLPVVVECHSLSNRTSSVASVINLSPSIAVTAIANSVQSTVVSMASSQQRGPMSEQLNVTAPQRPYVTPSRDTFASVQTTVSSLPPSYIDLHNTLTASPVLSTVARSPAARFVPGNNSQVVSSHLPQHASPVPNISIPVISLPSSQNRHLPRQPVQSITPTSAQTSTPPGYITLSHTTNVKPSTSKAYGVPLSLPHAQTGETTLRNPPSGKAKDLDALSAAESVIRRATIEACDKQRMDAASPKELLNAAMLISNYITDHPNSEHQDQWQSCLSAIVTDYHKNLDPSKGDSLQLVSIGYNPYVVLTQYDLEDMLDKSKGRPKYFALRLAEKLFGIDVLIKSTPYGIGGKAALHPVILDAIKVEVLRQFASDMSNEGQIALWKSCVTSIAQRCKRARNPRKDRSQTRASANNVDVSLPSMAVGGGIQLSEPDENDDSQGELDEEDDDCDMGSLDQSATRHTPPLIRIPSDDEKTPTKNGTEEGDYNDAGCITPVKDSTARPESVADSSMEKNDGTEGERSIPPGIDPDITVVHLPSNLQTSVEPQVKSTAQRQSSVVVTTRHATAGSGNSVSVSGEERTRIDTQQSVSGREGENNDESKEKGSPLAGNSSGNYMVQSFPNPNASKESVTVSGIRMTADYFHVLVGGNPNVVIPRQKYLDAVTKSSQPTHFAVRLAELVFGDDVLEASTVTGGKRGTMQLDPIMIKAIQMEVTERFLKTLDPEQQNVVWRKCVTSIATRCKTLRYNRAKTSENQWTLVHPSQVSPE